MRQAVLLLAYGGPEKLAEIKPFMQKLLRRETLPPGLVERVEKKYAAIGGGSPLPGICREIRDKLATRLEDQAVFLAFRYTDPSIEEVVGKIRQQGFDTILALSLSPHSSTISSRAYYDTLEKAVAQEGIELKRLENWYREEGYNRLLARRIAETAERHGLDLSAPDTHLLFSGHNIPQSYIDQGDTYVDEIKANISAVQKLLPAGNSSLAWQSKGNAPGAWLEPEIETHLQELKEKEISNLLVVPVSFCMDHLETLYDLDLELKDFCSGLDLNLYRTRPANADDDFIEMLADFIQRQSS